MDTIYQYRISCATCGDVEESVWRSEAPTECPNDSGHTVNDVVVVSKMSDMDVHVIEQPPFAKPDYRTKISKTTSVIKVAPGETKDIDYQMAEERYVSGGHIVVKNGHFGDHIKASVQDADSLIPELYRAALCEDWPTVAEYIEGAWIHYGGEYSNHGIDTYPLNAKITVGLYLRVTYSAAPHLYDFKGAWDVATAYAVGDTVTSGDKAYHCIQANTGEVVSNASYWEEKPFTEVLVYYRLTKKLD